MTRFHARKLEILMVAAWLASGVAAADSPAVSDQEMENFLLNAKIVESEALGTGVTKPYKLTLELDGTTRNAAFNYIDVSKPGVTKLPGGKSEVNFSDKYTYNRAAYLLDRRLGLSMVPVTVIRKWQSYTGSVVEWIEGTVTEEGRIEKGLEPPDPVLADQQKAIMNLFDVLIANVDRNQGNILWRMSDWKLYMIDMTRSFRQTKELPEAWVAKPASLPRALLTALESLQEEELKTLLKGLVTGPQIKAVIQRRDLILEKIAADRKSYGDNLVFQD
jgi:hypothetical protein